MIAFALSIARSQRAQRRRKDHEIGRPPPVASPERSPDETRLRHAGVWVSLDSVQHQSVRLAGEALNAVRAALVLDLQDLAQRLRTLEFQPGGRVAEGDAAA